jgi:hypothetical protein
MEATDRKSSGHEVMKAKTATPKLAAVHQNGAGKTNLGA